MYLIRTRNNAKLPSGSFQIKIKTYEGIETRWATNLTLNELSNLYVRIEVSIHPETNEYKLVTLWNF